MKVVNSEQKSGRIASFDFTKGILVLFMVFYHWLNYFISPTGWYYNYLRFITLSFIFISGFLITSVAIVQYQNEPRRLGSKLLRRGIKLLLLFTVLNIACSLFLPAGAPGEIGGVRSLSTFFENAKAVYLTGNGKGAAFQILVPISYIIILAGLLAFTNRRFKTSVLVCAGLGTALISTLEVIGSPSNQLYCLGSGILGLCIGMIPLPNIEKAFKMPLILIVSYCVYLTWISIRDVGYVSQMIGSLLTLLIIYWVAKKIDSRTEMYRIVVVLGQYSLFAYISQIALLQSIRIVLRHVNLGSISLIASLIASFGASILAVLVVDYIRSKDKAADRIYRYVFA